MTSVGRVLAALGTVYDPELDEPITSLRFVRSCSVGPDGDVDVRLRLPTPLCAPNFAFLMTADACEAVRRVPGVRRVTVSLEDHYTGYEINGAVARGAGFGSAFPGETSADDLEGLRELFLRKALVARQGAVCEELMAAGARAEEVVGMRVVDLPVGSATARRCLELRARLGIGCDPDAPAFVAAGGEPVGVEMLPRWLRMSRLVRTSLEANGGICRSLLASRHGVCADREGVI